jgi:hypothetical protein
MGTEPPAAEARNAEEDGGVGVDGEEGEEGTPRTIDDSVVNMGDAAEGEEGGKGLVVAIHAHIPPKGER